MHLIDLFPSTVLQNNIDFDISDDDIISFTKNKNVMCTPNVLGGNTYFTKNNNILQIKIFEKIRKEIYYNISKYMENVHGVGENKEKIYVKIVSSWMNIINNKNSGHHLHNHPNSFMSGVFYLRCNELEEDSIKFQYTNNNGTITPNTNNNLSFEGLVEEYHHRNSSTWRIPVKRGDLLIFPSNLSHYVEAQKKISEDNFRCSISYNTFIKGVLGDGNTTINLEL